MREDISEQIRNLMEDIENKVASQKYVFVGKGSSYAFGVTETRLKSACNLLKKENYDIHYLNMGDLVEGTDLPKIFKVIARDGVRHQEIWEYRQEIFEAALSAQD